MGACTPENHASKEDPLQSGGQVQRYGDSGHDAPSFASDIFKLPGTFPYPQTSRLRWLSTMNGRLLVSVLHRNPARYISTMKIWVHVSADP